MKGGMQGMLKQAQKMQEDMLRLQEEAGKKTVEASAGGGMVKVVANGKNEILSITIDPEVLKMNDQEMLQDLVRAGVNEALTAAKQMVQEEMKKLTAGLGPLGSMLGL
jgi:nucleoid-associated protein EbfC